MIRTKNTGLTVTHKISPRDTYKTTDEVTWRDVNGELVVLRLTSGEYYSFNSVGRLTWMNISEGKSIAEVIDTIALEYDVAYEQAESDVRSFVEGLLTNNLLYKD
jgi:hypothetical protein